MQNPIKSSRSSTSRKKPQSNILEQQENFDNESHLGKENIKIRKTSKSKVQSSSNEEESLLLKKPSRRKKIERNNSDDLNSNLHIRKLEIIEEKDVLNLNYEDESPDNNRNSLNNNIFLMPTQESSSNPTQMNTQGSLDQLKLANWGLPKSILKKYESRGIKSMFPWQVECLKNEKIIRENKNLVYSAPTSAGKTLVAEILVLKTVLERQKKVIFILPFVSVVREKMFYFQDLLSDSGVRVEGFMGSIAPAGGFQSVHIAIATIEKANSLINRLLEEENLISVGAVVIDELHLLGDPNRGYILELLLTKLRYISLRYEEYNIQLIGMSATLPNLSMLADWLNAELYKTDFRPVPLDEQCKIDSTIYSRELQLIRNLPLIPEIKNDTENIIQLCIETIEGGHSVLIFCPTKNWCEKLALQMASAFLSIGRSDSALGDILKTSLDASAIFETLEQLKRTPTGLDSVLKNTVSFGVSFHHAGLTIDERDIIEGSFRTGSLKVLVATSTLSTGVNLPARRVIIRSPSFHGKPLDTLSYRQMIGRAGRMGKDTAGESILICKSNERAIAETLLMASLEPIQSCLEDCGPLMRSLLEAIASEIVRTPEDLDSYIKCTFIHLQEEGEGLISKTIKEAVEFLVANEFLMLQETEEEHLKRWSATPLGKACLAASVPPKEGLFLFEELLKARKCLALDTELHVVYLVTPYNPGSQIGQIDWMVFLEMWSTMSEPEKRVAKLVGVEERFLTSAVRGVVAPGKNLNIHKRFYTALALYELVREIPLNRVCKKFGCCRGLLQSLQQSSSTYAGMITSFCKQLNWSCMELLVAQFQTRLQFGVSRDLMDLLRLHSLNGLRARSLFKEGITTVVELAVANELDIERALYKALPFESEKEHNGEGQFELAKQNKVRTTFITGKDGLTTRQAAILLIQEARTLLQNELGVREVKWKHEKENIHSTGRNSESMEQKSNLNTSEGTRDVIESQNLAPNLTNEKLNESKKNNNSMRNKEGIIIEMNKLPEKIQNKTNEIDLQSKSKRDSIILSGNYLPISQRSVYENIDKEVESALTEVFLVSDESNEGDQNAIKTERSPNIFDSECSVHDCSALEQNVLDSLRLSDFEMTNSSKKRSSGCTEENLLDNQVQETPLKPEIVESNPNPQTIDDMFSSADFNVNFTVERKSEGVGKKPIDANITEVDLEMTDFGETESKSVSGENIQELSGIHLSDFEFTAPQKINSTKIKKSSVKDTLSGIQASEFELSCIPQVKETSRRNKAKETSKRTEKKEESVRYSLSGINVSDFEMTKQNVTVRKSMPNFKMNNNSKKTEVEISKIKENEFLSGINISDFELSRAPRGLQNTTKKDNSKDNSQLRTSDFLLANISQSKLPSDNLPIIKSNIEKNDLKITKTKVASNISRDLKSRCETISLWEDDSWDNVKIKDKKCQTPDGKKRFKSNAHISEKEENMTRKSNIQKDPYNTPKKFMQKRTFSVAEGSPIVSVETYEKRRFSVVSNDSDSDDMFMPLKKIKTSGRTVINSNIQKIQPKNLAKNTGLSKTDSYKPGSGKTQSKSPKRISGEKLVRKSLENQSSFDSFVFSDGETFPQSEKDTKIPEISSEFTVKTEIDLQQCRYASVPTSKKMLTLLKQKLIRRTDISVAVNCETIKGNKVTIGAKILGDENSDDDKTTRSEKFVYGDTKICGIAISWGYHALHYIPLSNSPEMKVPLRDRVSFLTELFSNSSMNVRCFLAKKTYKLLYQCCGIVASCQFFDPIVAEWAVNTEEREKSMSYLVAKYYPNAYDYYQNNVIENYPQNTENNSTREALLIWYITEVLMKQIQEKGATLLHTYKEVEMQVLSVLARMELRGLGINLPALQELSDVIKREMSLLEKKAFFLAGKKFNFTSSTSVAQVLGLQKRKKVSTSKAILEQCTNPISKLIISWRKLNSLHSMMVIPLLNAAQNSRIHGFHITHTVTGRVSMHEPNLQNVPKDFSSEDGTFVISLRMAFIPTIGNLMLSADYCQLELRILAHFANDSLLRSIMRKEGNDIFKSISAQWNNITEDMVDDKMRQRTKQLCYGMIYGMGTKSLAESLAVTESEAKEFLETFMGTYKGIRSWLSNVVERARVDGYVKTITKRCRILPELWSENRFEKSQAERQAINTKIQGSAADIAKKAMVLIDKKLQQEFSTVNPIFPVSRSKKRLRSSGASLEFRGAYLVLQLHDELLFEVNANDLHLVAKLVKESMENAYSLEVPLPVKMKVGPAWGDLREYNLDTRSKGIFSP